MDSTESVLHPAASAVDLACIEAPLFIYADFVIKLFVFLVNFVFCFFLFFFGFLFVLFYLIF